MRNTILRKKIKLFAFSLGVMFLAACSENEFGEQDLAHQSYEVNVGQVDILFVVDNSGSMSEEQRKMADSFRNFMQGTGLPGLDYRIGIVTTDVESSTNPLKDFGQGKGALQNGNLIQFPDGSYFLTPQSSNIESQFWTAITREETEDCERSGYSSSVCPSDDERGIYSAYLTVNANKRNFFRKDGHVSFIFLSDEDVRGHGNTAEQYPYRMPEARDYPANLIQVVKSRLGKNTTMSAHAIITNSQSCLNEQNVQNGNVNIDGKIGTFYKALTNPNAYSLIDSSYRYDDFAEGQLVEGVVGSICSNNYTAELGDIKNVLSKLKTEEKLKCILDKEDSLDVRISQDYSWELNESRDAVVFSPGLPPGQSFKIEYDCYVSN